MQVIHDEDQLLLVPITQNVDVILRALAVKFAAKKKKKNSHRQKYDWYNY